MHVTLLVKKPGEDAEQEFECQTDTISFELAKMLAERAAKKRGFTVIRLTQAILL